MLMGFSAATQAADLSLPSKGVDDSTALVLRVPHPFSRDEAEARLGFLLRYWEERFDIKNRWEAHQVFLSGSVYGLKFDATFSVDDGKIVGVARDPGWPWRGQVLSYVDRKLKKYLHPTYAEPQ